MSSGIDALKELFNVSEERKNYNMSIHFNIRDLEYNQIFDLRTKIVEVRLENIIKSYEYLPSSTQVPDWSEGYLSLTKQALPVYEWSLRLFFDMNKMLAYKISMNKIIKMIRDKAPPSIVVIPSPMSMGILDLYPKEDEIDKQFGENSSLMFLSVSVLPIIQQFLLSGISGIEGLFPTSIPVLSIISEEIPVSDDSNEYYLSFSRTQMKKTGIDVDDLRKLFNFVGIKIIDEQREGIYVEMPEKSKSDKGYPFPMKYIKNLLKEEEDKMDEEEKQMKIKQLRGFMAESSDFYQSSKCWTAETNGKNFLEVIKLPEVDPYYTYSNDFYEISSLLGIEATRTLLTMELKNVLQREEYINMRHISLLVDVMTNLGRLTPISFYGALRFGQGSLSLATNQQSMKVFTGSSAFGKRETVDSVSASVMLGMKAKIGAGFVDIISKQKDNQETHEKEETRGEIEEQLELQNEDIVEQQNIETNQAYMDVMFNTYEGEIYGKRKSIKDIDMPRIVLPIQHVEKIKENVPKLQEPKLQETKLHEPKLQEPKLQEPKLQQPKLQEPKLQEPKLQETKISEVKTPALSLPKKTSVRLGGLADISQRMKMRKNEMNSNTQMNTEVRVDDSLNVLFSMN
jgi:hypothetical protein